MISTKINRLILLLFLCAGWQAFSQEITSIKASSEDISDNLNLEAVASVFGESKDLEDFEKRLNDPDTRISNLDLNNDEEVDYLRVMETVKNKIHVISIQAVIGNDQYQEVAVIEVQKDSKGITQVLVIGNIGIFGFNYYISPYYPIVPVFFSYFWVATYIPWYSPWYWGYWPVYFRPWPPVAPHLYRSHVRAHINVQNTYNRTTVSINDRSSVSAENNDYFIKNPDMSFTKRNPGVSNRDELLKQRQTASPETGVDAREKQKTKGKKEEKPSQKSQARPSKKKASNKPGTLFSYLNPPVKSGSGYASIQ